ncbi:hypothetical protein [Streptomyces agglomeratus]|nr:hypothetical protein [Streptomyces agglomeratus]
MPTYLTRRDADHHVQELEAPAVTEAADRAADESAQLAWPGSAAAAGRGTDTSAPPAP